MVFELAEGGDLYKFLCGYPGQRVSDEEGRDVFRQARDLRIALVFPSAGLEGPGAVWTLDYTIKWFDCTLSRRDMRSGRATWGPSRHI